jgi:hypothetical protein
VGRYHAFTSPSTRRATLDPTHPAGSTHPHCFRDIAPTAGPTFEVPCRAPHPPTPRPGRRAPTRRSTGLAGPCVTCASRSPAGATSAAPTACPRRSSAAATRSWTVPRFCRSRKSNGWSAAAALGVRKARLTGGEPLLRRDLERLVAMLADVPGIEDLALTTNGVLLPQKAQALRNTGLGRVTINLDALDEPTFQAMNDVDMPLARVLKGIDMPLGAGTEGHRRGGRGRVSAGQAQHRRQAGRQRPRAGSPGPLCPRRRPHRAVHRVHGRRHQQRLATPGGRARRRDHPSGSTPRSPWSRSKRTIQVRSPAAGATRTAPGSSA